MVPVFPGHHFFRQEAERLRGIERYKYMRPKYDAGGIETDSDKEQIDDLHSAGFE